MTSKTVIVPVRNRDAVRAGAENATEMTALQAMASRMWRIFLVMGFMTVTAAFIIGIINGLNLGDFFSDPASIRNADANHENFGTVQAILVWLTPLTLLGVGFMLVGITQVLATILGNLRIAGANVQAAVGAQVEILRVPTTGKIFPMLMFSGLFVLLGALGVGAWLGTVQGSDVFSHTIADIGGAEAGSDLLADQGTVAAVSAWLVPMSFFGMALLFSAITLALGTIVTVLRFQAKRIVQIAVESAEVAPAE